MNQLKTLINQNEKPVVCFDYFDTIVSRILSPEEVKRSWAKHCSEYFFPGISWEIIYQARRKTEKALYHNSENNYEFNYRMLIAGICQYLKETACILNDSWNEEDFYRFSYKCELNLEMCSQILNQDVVEMIQFCKNKQIEMVVLSDFYLDKHAFQMFLKKFDLLSCFSNTFVSCDVLKSKHKGDLFDYVMQCYPNCSLIMIGDNENTDIINGKKHGFNCIRINRKKVFKKYSTFEQKPYDYLKKALHNISKDESSFLSNYAFTLYLFIERLYKKATSEKCHNLIFLSRDGEFLKILFDIYKMRHPVDAEIATHYLLVSRNSTYLAACRPVEEEQFDGIFSHYKDVKLEDFLISLSFTDEQIQGVCSELKCNKTFCFSRNDQGFIHELKHNNSFRMYYEGNRKKAKEMFSRYLEQELNHPKEIWIVDIGWRGTIQDNLYEALDEDVIINGFYYGLTEERNIKERSKKEGIVFSCKDKDSKDYIIYSFEYWFIENILTGSHGKVASYSEKDGIVNAILSADSDKLLYELYMKDLREEIIKKFENINNAIIASRFDTDDYIDEFYSVHYRLSRFFPIVRIKDNFIIRELHSQGFGLVKNTETIPQKGWYSFYVKNYSADRIKGIIKEYKTLVYIYNNAEIKRLINLKCHQYATKALYILFAVRRRTIRLKNKIQNAIYN